MGDRFKAPRRVKSRSQLVGERLIMGKAVCLGRADGLLVKVHGVERSALDPGDLGAGQRGAIFEIIRAIFCPYFQLSVVRAQSFEMLLAFVGRCGIAAGCCSGQSAVKVIFRGFKTGWRCPKQSLRL
jgi:hypothetical protein